MADNKAAALGHLNFENTEVAFSYMNNSELKNTHRLFKFMNNPTMVKIGSRLGTFAVKYNLPFAERITLATIYKQFVGGRTLLEVQNTSEMLSKFDIKSFLDYGVEGVDDAATFNSTMTECIRAIEFASQGNSIPVAVIKLTGLTKNEVLIKVSNGEKLLEKEQEEFDALIKRVGSICHVAKEKGVSIYIDAEESWYQPAVDEVYLSAAKNYNQRKAVVFNTYQMYLKTSQKRLEQHLRVCRESNVKLGAKVVRGAYMNKEAKRAQEKGYENPVNPSKAATDEMFNNAIAYCLENIDDISFVNASHNQLSVELMIKKMNQLNISKNHPNLIFCQLYGMSDNLTFNLANAGFPAAKYVPYGPVKEVVPYLVRRAEENKSITGETSRELKLLKTEMKRRNLI